MENTQKIIIVLLIVILVTSLFFLIFNNPFTGLVIQDRYTHTKAICDDTNFCQDYEITCVNGNLVEMKSITGATIQHSLDWQDPRDEKTINKFCE